MTDLLPLIEAARTRTAQHRATCTAEGLTAGPWKWWMSPFPPFDFSNERAVDIGVRAMKIPDAEFIGEAREHWVRTLDALQLALSCLATRLRLHPDDPAELLELRLRNILQTLAVPQPDEDF